MHDPVAALDGVIRDYPWGSHTALAELQGRRSPTPEPEAELWFGAHPLAPAVLRLADGGRRPLDAAVSEAPVTMLGEATADRFGASLPYLLKILAVGSPLSLQAHPDATQARDGFAREEADGVPRDAPQRCFRDPVAKPELLCALTPMQVLCGFQPVGASVELLRSLEVADLDDVARELAAGGAPALLVVLRRLLSWPAARRTALVAAVAAACDDLASRGGPAAGQARWTSELAALYPGDPGVVATLLLHLVELPPGGAVHVPAGTLHAYLQGTGVEVMAASDNVVRGGLTSKHVDVDRLVEIVEPAAGPPPLVPTERADDELVYVTPTDEFRLSQLRLGGAASLGSGLPQILLAVDGEVGVVGSVSGDGDRPEEPLSLRSGQAVFVPAATREVTLTGTGVVFRVTPGHTE